MTLVAALGLGILGLGASSVASCIIPDKGISVADPDCGFRWCGMATDAHAFNGANAWTDVLVSGNEVEGCVCFSQGSHDILTDGIALGCHTRTDEMNCELWAPDCEWVENIEGSGVDLCLPSAICFQSRWLEIVSATVAECEAEAANQVMDTTPADCFSVMGEGTCNGTEGCQWSGGGCIIDANTCTTGAFSAPVFDKNEACSLPHDECEGATGGGDEGGACFGADDTTGEPYGGDGWGELSKLISCSSSTNCMIDQDLIDAVAVDPTQMLDDDTRLSFETIGGVDGVLLTGIDAEQATGELVMALKLEEDDLIYDVDGLPLTDEQGLLAAVDYLMSVSTATVRLRRDGTIVSITYSISSQ